MNKSDEKEIVVEEGDANGDDETTDDEELVPINSIHNRRGSGNTSTVHSTIRILEDRAWEVHKDTTRSIGGRLGGHFDTTRSYLSTDEDDGETDDDDDEFATEETSLVKQQQRLTPSSPPLTAWIAPALSCAAAYAFYNIFIKKGSSSINPILGGVILQFVAAALGTFLLLAILCSNSDAQGRGGIHCDRYGLVWSVLAGLAVGSAEMLSFYVSSLGVQASQFIPIIIGGSVLFGAVLGLVVLGETMMWHGWFGVVLLVSGIALVATDPGDKVEESMGGDDDDNVENAVPMGSPPLVVWIAPALVCASMYAFYNIFIKKGSASINPILGGVILQFVAALFGSSLLGALVVHEGGTGLLKVSGTGIFWASCAGVAVGAAEMLSFCVSGMGVDATKSIPIIIGGSVMFGAVLGLLMLGESLMLQGWFGVAVLMTGIGFVATDPGEKVAGH